ncbi:MAG TPA: hypothetical protein VES66_06430 [Terriglobales bacterium]|nr:hypothetical protein [Terriglobales bacterium]
MALWLLPAILAGCTHDPPSITAATLHEIHDVTSRTVPADGSLVRTAEAERNGFRVQAMWAVQTRSDAAHYVQWVKGRMPEYHVTSETASTVTFVKTSDGDAYYIDIAARPTALGIVAEIRFTAEPD